MTPLKVLGIGPADYSAAVTLLRKFSDQDITTADAAGLQLMTSRRIKSCWSTDFHLGLTGVPLVIHSSHPKKR
jgi:hypothetical protein